MPTSSITKEFIIKDRKIYEKFLEDINKPLEEEKIKTTYLEDGKMLLEECFNFKPI